MRASEDDTPGDTSRPTSGFKVFGRVGAESAYADEIEADPSTATSSSPDAHAADDPFAALDDEEDAFELPRPVAPRTSSASSFAHASHEVLEADFPFASRAPLEPTAPRTAPAAVAAPIAAPMVSPTNRPTEPAADVEARPEWYRDPACLVHLIPLAGTLLILTGFGLIPGLLIENSAGRRDDFVRDQARESINFQLNFLMLNLLALITFTAPIVWPISLCFGIVLPIQAALDVKSGKRHRYPLVPRWLD